MFEIEGGKIYPQCSRKMWHQLYDIHHPTGLTLEDWQRFFIGAEMTETWWIPIVLQFISMAESGDVDQAEDVPDVPDGKKEKEKESEDSPQEGAAAASVPCPHVYKLLADILPDHDLETMEMSCSGAPLSKLNSLTNGDICKHYHTVDYGIHISTILLHICLIIIFICYIAMWICNYYPYGSEYILVLIFYYLIQMGGSIFGITSNYGRPFDLY